MEEANGFSGQEADKVKLRGQRVSGRKFRLKALCMSSYLDSCRKGEDLIHASLCPNLYMTEGQLNNNNMVTSKRQKTNERNQFCGARFSINIWVFLIDNPTTPSPLSKMP